MKKLFATDDSIVHRLDPRMKMAFALLFSIVVALGMRLWGAGLGLVVALVLVALSSLKPWAVLERLAVVNIFILFLWVTLPFTYPGEPVFGLGALAASREGILYAFLITLKSNAIVLSSMALLATSSMVEMGHALKHLRVPDKMVQMLLFTVRYFSVIHQEYHRLRCAMKVRGFRPRTSLHTYRSYGYLVAMLLVRSYERSQRIYAAMRCRGFKGKFYLLRHFALARRDVVFAFAMTVLLILLGLLQWTPIII